MTIGLRLQTLVLPLSLWVYLAATGCSSPTIKPNQVPLAPISNETSLTTVQCRSSEPTKEVVADPREKTEFSLSFYPGKPFPGEMKVLGFNRFKPKEEVSPGLDLDRPLRPAIFKSVHSSLEVLADMPGYMIHFKAEDEVDEGHPFKMTMDIRFSKSRRQVFSAFQCCIDSQIAIKEGQWICQSKSL